MRFFSLGSRWTGFFLLALGLMLGQATRATAASQLTITWDDNSADENGFTVKRKTGLTGTYAQIAQVGANVTSFIDSTVTAGTTYYYRVRAFNSAGNSAYSNEAYGTPPVSSQRFTLTVNKTGTGGTVTSTPAGINCGATCTASYTSGTSVILSATAGPGSTFSGWSSGGCSGTGTCTILTNANPVVTATFTPTALPPASSLAAAYSFNEGSGTTVEDASGEGFTGTLVNGVRWTEGRNGTAVSFDGRNDKVTLPSTVDITGLPFTLEAWIRPTSFADWRVIFSKRASNATSQMRFDVGLEIASGRVYVTTSSSTVTSTYAPPLYTWTHIAVVAESGGTTLYVNGEPWQTLGAVTLGSGATAPVAIGNTGDDDDPFSGQIDDLRLYTRALSPAEIETDMNTAVTP